MSKVKDANSNKREEFRKYLEEAGAMDILTRALSELYTENDRPTDVIDYIKCFLAENKRPEGDISILRSELKDAKIKLKICQQNYTDMKERLSKYEDVDAPPESEEPREGKEEEKNVP